MRSPFPALALDLLNGVPQRFSLVTSLLFSSKLLCSVWCFWMQSYQAMVFPVVIHRCELDHKEGWEPKNWCFQTTVLEKTPESPLACKQIKPVNPKGNKSWIFIGRTCWSWSSNTLATWYKESTLWKRLWCLERLRAGGEWGVAMRWLGGIIDSMDIVWANSKRQWRTGKPGMLQSVWSQRVRHDLATEKQINDEHRCET